jgi:uncharacterized membrane protein
MYTPALMAFLHHLAAFTVVGALAAEVVLFKPPLTALQALKLQRVDLIFGIAATAVLVIVCAADGPGYRNHRPTLALSRRLPLHELP